MCKENRKLEYLKKYFMFCINTILIIDLIIIVIIVFWQVLSRNFLPHSYPWTVELARICFLWLCIIGSVKALDENEHFSIDLLVKKMPKKLESFISLFLVNVINIIFLIFLFYSGISYLEIASRTTTLVLRLNKIWVFIFVPIGSFFMMILCVTKIVDYMQKMNGKN